MTFGTFLVAISAVVWIATSVIIVALLWHRHRYANVFARIGWRWVKDVRGRARRIDGIVRELEDSSDVFEGRDAPSALNRRLADALDAPDREVGVRLGLGAEYLGRSLGDRRAMGEALELAGELEPGHPILPFDVRMETGKGLIPARGVVVPLGRLDGAPVAMVVGFGNRGPDLRAQYPDLFVLGGFVDARGVFSAIAGSSRRNPAHGKGSGSRGDRDDDRTGVRGDVRRRTVPDRARVRPQEGAAFQPHPVAPGVRGTPGARPCGGPGLGSRVRESVKRALEPRVLEP